MHPTCRFQDVASVHIGAILQGPMSARNALCEPLDNGTRTEHGHLESQQASVTKTRCRDNFDRRRMAPSSRYGLTVVDKAGGWQSETQEFWSLLAVQGNLSVYPIGGCSTPCADAIVAWSRTIGLRASRSQNFYDRRNRLRGLAAYPRGTAGTASRVSDRN